MREMTFRHEGRITRGSFRGLVAAVLLMAAPAGAVTLTRGPYLQLESTHGVTVVWDTDAPAACSLDVRPVGGSPTVIAGSTGTVCAIRADGLVPGTRYAYAPQANGVALAGEEVFETDHPTLPFTFLVMGESGCGGCMPGLALRDAMYATPVAFHDTIYSSGSHGSDLTVRANLVPLFDKYGVDMVFMGDDHDYERTKPLRNNVAVQPGAGTVYVTTGGGGDQLRPVGASSFTAYAESAFHFTRVTVNGGRLI